MLRKVLFFAVCVLFVAGLPPLFMGPPWTHGAISPVIEIMQARLFRNPASISYDSDRRLSSYPDKTVVACPSPGPDTAVLLIAGQSNAANSGGQKYRTQYGGAVVNFFAGKCYLAESPLLGSSGEWGELWTPLANRLVQSGAYKAVVLAPVAVSGSTIEMWMNGKLAAALQSTIVNLKEKYEVTHVVWYQGEADFMLGTSERQYRSELSSIFASVRSDGVPAPIYVSSATRCANSALNWSPDNAVSRAQKAILDPVAKVFVGADADGLLSGLDRYDDCHLSASGADKLAESWAVILTSER